MPHRRRITLMMDLVGGYGRGLYVGIAKYAKLIGHWELWTQPSTVWVEREEPWNWDVDGALIFGRWAGPVRAAARRGVPMVSMSAVGGDVAVPIMEVDHLAVGRLAAAHLLERGLKHLGFVGWEGSEHCHVRYQGFRERVGADADLIRYDYPTAGGPGNKPVWPEPGLVKWLTSAPRPIGVFAANDELASCVVDAARSTAMAIPEQVAVLGVDNDDVVLQRSLMPLSTIELPAARLGYEAAALLDRLMDGEKAKPRPASDFPPVRVVARQSTDISAVGDADVAMAMRLIRDRAISQVSMQDIAAAVAMSTRSLELRFRKAIGQSPGEFLIRTRLEQAQRLLLETDLKLSAIAKRSAFCSISHFGSIFRRYVGMTPTAYRENRRIT